MPFENLKNNVLLQKKIISEAGALLKNSKSEIKKRAN
jgi:hypothetical protein